MKVKKGVKLLFIAFSTIIILAGCSFNNTRHRSWYEKSGDNVYFNTKRRDEPKHRIQVIGVDIVSFVILDDDYAKDKNTVYYNGKLLDQAKPSTFEVIGYGYAKDQIRVYHYKGEIIGADPESFQVLQHIFVGYAKDNISAFFDGEKIVGADPETIEYLSEWYAKDENFVYTNGYKIEGADPSSFMIIDTFFSKDKNTVYAHFDGKRRKIPDFDPASFEVVNSRYLKDKDNVYYYYGLLSAGAQLVNMDADPNTFELCCDDVNSLCKYEEFSKDKDRAYHRDHIMKSGDPDTTQRRLDHYYEAGLCLINRTNLVD